MTTTKEFLEEKLKRKLQEGEPLMRSCWNCNGSHEHLKKEKLLLWCFACGNFYLKGKMIK